MLLYNDTGLHSFSFLETTKPCIVMLKHSLEVAERLPHGSAYSYNAFGMPLPALMVSVNLYNSATLRLEKTYES